MTSSRHDFDHTSTSKSRMVGEKNGIVLNSPKRRPNAYMCLYICVRFSSCLLLPGVKRLLEGLCCQPGI
jgi:hypothetical protein